MLIDTVPKIYGSRKVMATMHKLLWLNVFAILMLCLPVVARAQSGGSVVGVKGSCESLVIAGQPGQCLGGLMYVHTPNGNVFFAVGIGGNRMIAFVGEKDSQPRLEDYHLYLSRLRIVSAGSEFVTKVAGQCIVQMSRDGKSWNRIECAATDENNADYKMIFKSDGTPVLVEQSGEKAAPATWPRP